VYELHQERSENLSDNAITPEGLEALRNEIEHLETVERPKIVDRIKTAREWGDLKENSEYHDAKNDQGLLEAKIKRLNARLHAAVPVQATTSTGKVAFGSTVELVALASGRRVEYTLVGSTEADTASGRISSESPVGQALIGAKVGQTVAVRTPSGQLEFEVQAVR
jgi:transcription elongation factor GreA